MIYYHHVTTAIVMEEKLLTAIEGLSQTVQNLSELQDKPRQRWYSVAETAQIFGLSRDTVMSWVKKKFLVYGRDYFIATDGAKSYRLFNPETIPKQLSRVIKDEHQ